METGAFGTRSFQAGGTFTLPLSDKEPFDIRKSTVRVVVGDGAGRDLLDVTAGTKDGDWIEDKGAWLWKAADARTPVQSIRFGAYKAGHENRIEGELPAENFSPKDPLKPIYALYVDFPGSGSKSLACSAVTTPICVPDPMDQARFMVCGDGMGPGK